MAKKEVQVTYYINFTGRKETLVDIFGTKDLTAAEMTKTLWSWVKNAKIVKGVK